jgi:catechol 2,3-dioxygenase-like lactoylglutathione lyase family enzyme
MLDHVSITVSDIAVAEPFYDAIMKALEVVKVGRREDWLGYGERARAANPERVYISIRKGAKPDDAAPPALVLQGEVADPGRRLLGRRDSRRRQR